MIPQIGKTPWICSIELTDIKAAAIILFSRAMWRRGIDVEGREVMNVPGQEPP